MKRNNSTPVRARELEVTRRDLRKRVHSAFATALYQAKAFPTQNQIAQSVQKVVATTQARGGCRMQAMPSRKIWPGWKWNSRRPRWRSSAVHPLREQAILGLAAAIGDSRLSVKSLAGSLDTTFEIPTLETLAANLAAQPEIALADANLRAS